MFGQDPQLLLGYFRFFARLVGGLIKFDSIVLFRRSFFGLYHRVCLYFVFLRLDKLIRVRIRIQLYIQMIFRRVTCLFPVRYDRSSITFD